jgi:predicted P-loop ATPase
LHRTKSGKISDTPENMRLALLRLGVTLRYDSFGDRIVIDGFPGFPLLDDPAATRLWVTFQEAFGFKAKWDEFNRVLDVIAREKAFNPVLYHLDALPPWDRVSRLDRWLITHCGAEDKLFNRTVGALFLIAAIRRIKHPGCKFDTMLTLIGPQGCGKSTVPRILAGNDEWFTDGVSLGADMKTLMETIAGK